MQAYDEGDVAFLCMVTAMPTDHEGGEEAPQPADETAFAQKVRLAVQGDRPADLRLRALLLEKEGLFPDQLPATLPPDRGLPSVVPLEPGARPPAQRMFRYSLPEQEEMQRQITDLLAKGFIEPSCSPFGAPVLFVKKKDGTLRMCVDYRAVNNITIKNRYPLPRIDDLLDRLRGAKVFSSLDLTQGYHQVRLPPSDVERTAFRTPFGHYQYKVMPFGLTNAPAIFQSAMNAALQGLPYVVVYLDDILIFSHSAEEHVAHLRTVLERLEQHQFYCKLSKCDFFKSSVTFLGHIVSADGVRPDPRKTAAVQGWSVPSGVPELRAFLGLANYFRKFIRAYAAMAAPLTNLLSPKVLWRWTEECDEAFQWIKEALTTAPVLALPDPHEPFEVITDASDFAIGAILLQHGRPVAFESRKLIPAERNYVTTERELLAVVHALKLWRCYLEGVKFTVVTDHEPNTAMRRKTLLTRRQARWSELLESFDFDWQYRAGRCNPADPLSRLPGHVEVDMATVMMISARRLGEITSFPSASAESQCSFPKFEETIRDGYGHDAWFADTPEAADVRKAAGVLQRNGFWCQGDRVVVPDYKGFRVEILRLCHDHPMSGHAGVTKTLHLAQRHFWWPKMRRMVGDYVRTCDSCQRVKASSSLPGGMLLPLPIPDQKWSVVTMDFITDLPPDPKGNTSIYVFVDKLTKMVRFVPCTATIDSVGAAEIFFNTIVCSYGVPQVVVSDRDPKFTAAFTESLYAGYDIDLRHSSAYHPETDGQTERVNRVLEDMLRHYVAGEPASWSRFLPMVEFAMNNSVHESTRTTPFRLMYGYEPLTPASHLVRSLGEVRTRTLRERMVQTRARAVAKGANLGAELASANADAPGVNLGAELANPLAVRFSKDMQRALERAKACLHAARDRMKKWTDERRSKRELSVGDRVLLSTQHMRIEGPRKLLPRFIGPFAVTETINQVAYRLDLPPSVRMHNVFHVSLLRRYHDGGRVKVPPPPDIVDGELEFEVERVLLHKEVKERRRTVRYYLMRWKGQGPEYDSWEPEVNLTNCGDLLRDYWAQQGANEQFPTSPPKSARARGTLAGSEPQRAPTVTSHGRSIRKPARFSMLLIHLFAISGVPDTLLSHTLWRWK